MPQTKEMTIKSLIATHAEDIAFVTEQDPATTLNDFITQIGTAVTRMEDAGINGTEDLEDATTYLADLEDAADSDKHVLLKQAAKRLRNTWDMVDEYREMV